MIRLFNIERGNPSYFFYRLREEQRGLALAQLKHLKEYDKVKVVSKRNLPALCQHSPISVWIEDFSEIRDYFDSLKKKGISDLLTYSDQHPGEVLSLAKKVKILDVNNATLDLFQAATKEELYRGLHKVFNKDPMRCSGKNSLHYRY